jgi:DNA-binding beta-propeller fold protein YncE
MARPSLSRACLVLGAAAFTGAAGCNDSVTGPLPYEQPPPFVRQFAGYGPDGAPFRYPLGIAADPAGAVYVADQNGPQFVKFGPDGAVLYQRSLSEFSGPFRSWINGIAAGTDRVYVAIGEEIAVFDGDGHLLGSLRVGAVPGGLAVGPQDVIYVAGTGEVSSGESESLPIRATGIFQFSPDGPLVKLWDDITPGKLAVDGDGNVVVGRSYRMGEPYDPAHPEISPGWDLSTVTRYSPQRALLGQWRIRLHETSSLGWQMAVDASGNVYSGENSNGVWKYSPGGRLLAQWTQTDDAHEPLGQVAGVTLSRGGDLYILDYLQRRVVEYAP